MDTDGARGLVETVYQKLCEMWPRRVDEGEQPDMRREASAIVGALPTVGINVGDTNDFVYGTEETTRALQDLMTRAEFSIQTAVDMIDAHLATVDASLGPDDHELDDPVRAASIQIELLGKLRDLLSPSADELDTGERSLLRLLKSNDRDLRDEIRRNIINQGARDLAPAIAAWYERRQNALAGHG